jgi:hypothetical protein
MEPVWAEGGAAAGAEDLDDGPTIRATNRDHKLKIEFDDELVKGDAVKPNVDFAFTRSQFNYKKLIRLREDFIKEVEKDKNDFHNKH